jgi:hypothetical protein
MNSVKQTALEIFIGNLTTQWCDIFCGEKSVFRFECNGELVNVPQDPIQYPCIFVYHKMSYNQFGMFIYKDDWKKDFENTSNNSDKEIISRLRGKVDELEVKIMLMTNYNMIDDDLGSPFRKHILDD